LTNCEMCGMLDKSGKVYFSGLFVFGFWLGEWVEWGWRVCGLEMWGAGDAFVRGLDKIGVDKFVNQWYNVSRVG